LTTLAYRDGVLASDSRFTWAGNVKASGTKMWRLQSRVSPVRGEVLLGISGYVSAALLFKDWLETGDEPHLVKRGVDDDCFGALIVHKSGLYVADRLCRLDVMAEEFWADGSGGDFALAAMACGKSAAEAVRIAARFDCYTGGRIVSMRLASPARRASRKGAR
jgi:hypothetical protein